MVALRVEVLEPDRASAIAAASGESESRLKFVADALDVSDCLFSAASCCCEMSVATQQ